MSMAARRRLLPHATVVIDSQPARCETRYAQLGAWTFHLASCLPDHGIELHSTYTGTRGADTQAQHLELAPGYTNSFAQPHDEQSLPVWRERRSCLLDHLALLQEHIASLGHDARIDALEQAFQAIER
jgi:hypothetical protein